MPNRFYDYLMDNEPVRTGDGGHSYRLRRTERPVCGQRRWTGSHVACVCYADHDGPHESAEGDRWHTEETL